MVAPIRKPRTLWKRDFRGAPIEFTGVAADDEGNVFVAGNIWGTFDLDGARLASAGGLDVFIAKLTRSGQLEWAHQFGSAGREANPAIRVDAKGSVAILVTQLGRSGGAVVYPSSDQHGALDFATPPDGGFILVLGDH